MKNIGLKTISATLGVFGLLYMSLVFSSRAGEMIYLIVAFFSLTTGIFLFIKSQKIVDNNFLRNLFAIFSGVFVWGFLGEFLEKADTYIPHATTKIAHWNFLPILAIVIFIFLQIRKNLKVPVQFSLSSFLLIWTMHFIMIFQFDVLSRTHYTTYIMAFVFLFLTGFSILKYKKNTHINSQMFWSYLGLLSTWSILEYVWGWRWIPGPYSI